MFPARTTLIRHLVLGVVAVHLIGAGCAPAASSRSALPAGAAAPGEDCAAAHHAGGPGPLERVYKRLPDRQLRVHLFTPPDDPPPAARRPAMVIFHGGGWHVGEPQWMFPTARHYAERGLVAAAVEYRLSDQAAVTPIEAMADARDAIRWVRRNAACLRVDPARIAAYGVSAGAHLAASTAMFRELDSESASAVPDALILHSPAVSLGHDGWFQRLLGARASAADLSPDLHVADDPPPAILLVGAQDTVTPLDGAQRFCEAVRAAGGRCDLHAYPGLGHLLTRNLDPRAQEQGPFDTDPAAAADARRRSGEFLVSLGYLATPAGGADQGR